ncbi:MAG: glycosyltransferase family protein [Patescibacteria group bacterium]|nr:glycosyltransferase family protein [Patescibacteria group bacterium]MDE2438452.1 glycosyltransferase family protein [Patescibacteria group bacterium]
MSTSNPIDIIIQARMGSTRLPGKVLKPFHGTTVLEYLVERARTSRHARHVVVATTVDKKDDVIESLCKKSAYRCVRGSENDVLRRYYDAARALGSDVIVRLTADDPFTDMQECDVLIQTLLTHSFAYVGSHRGGIPLGTGAEAFTFEALKKAHEEAAHPYEREHVTPYFYEHPELFAQTEIEYPNYAPLTHMRLTLDTPEDYEVLSRIADEIGKEDPTLPEIVAFLKERPDITARNSHVQQKPLHA